MQKLPIIILIALLAGCSNLRFPWVYRIDIPQGNFVTEEMLGDLESGMTPEQVEYVLGVPTLVDPFTADTWFYLLTYEPGKGETVTQEIVVHFSDGTYSHYDGEVTGDLKAKTTAGSDRALSERAEDRRRDVDEVELPAPNPEADGDSASDSADADAAEDAGDASASDKETSNAIPSSDG